MTLLCLSLDPVDEYMLLLDLREVESDGVDQIPVLMPPGRGQSLQHLGMGHNCHFFLGLLVVVEKLLPHIQISIQIRLHSFESPLASQYPQNLLLRTPILINVFCIPVRQKPSAILNLQLIGLTPELGRNLRHIGGDWRSRAYSLLQQRLDEDGNIGLIAKNVKSSLHGGHGGSHNNGVDSLVGQLVFDPLIGGVGGGQ